jgi:formylglycine-generating enzyme required for sulfatase activity
MVSGPCSTGARGPELAGLRPDGATPDGVQDLVGNVAEWTAEADLNYAARGGSFRSRVAGSLKNWSVEGATAPADHIGFRCAYDVETE